MISECSKVSALKCMFLRAVPHSTPVYIPKGITYSDERTVPPINAGKHLGTQAGLNIEGLVRAPRNDVGPVLLSYVNVDSDV